jgi:hypothetical protein
MLTEYKFLVRNLRSYLHLQAAIFFGEKGRLLCMHLVHMVTAEL